MSQLLLADPSTGAFHCATWHYCPCIVGSNLPHCTHHCACHGPARDEHTSCHRAHSGVGNCGNRLIATSCFIGEPSCHNPHAGMLHLPQRRSGMPFWTLPSYVLAVDTVESSLLRVQAVCFGCCHTLARPLMCITQLFVPIFCKHTESASGVHCSVRWTHS
jgi:hypothetical protein